MRVLMICTEKLPVPPVRGGAVQTYIDAITSGLSERHDLTILGVTDERLPKQERRNGATYVRVPGGAMDLYTMGVIRLLQEEEFDIIHVFNRPRLIRHVRANAPRARIVLSLHNDMFEPGKIDPAEAAEVIRQVDTLITVSDYVGQRVAALYPQVKPKLRTVYSAVDLDRFAPRWTQQAARVRRRLRSELCIGNGPVILYVGRISPKKGVDVLIRAMPQVAKRHPGTALVLVGSKWYGANEVTDYVAYVRALAAKCPAKVITSGFVPPDQVHHWFWLGDLFVCASQWEEPLARVHYEAMAAGVPIVTTDRGGNPEVVRGYGNGVVVERYDEPEAFARVLSDLLADPAGRELMGQRGRELVEERFGWSRVIQDIDSVWQSPTLGVAPGQWDQEASENALALAASVEELRVDPKRQKSWQRDLERLRVRAHKLELKRQREREEKRKLLRDQGKVSKKGRHKEQLAAKSRRRRLLGSNSPMPVTPPPRSRRNQVWRKRLLGRW